MAEVQQLKPPHTPPPTGRVNRDELSSAEEYPDEKGRSHRDESTYHEEDKVRDPTSDAYEPNVWKPFEQDPDAPEETHQLTVRALVVGSVLGAVVGASNIYLGLKTGFTFGPQLFGAIFGFAILKPLSKAIPESGILGKLLGGHFGPKENCTVQTAATASGGLGILFVSAIPAMYRLDLLSVNPRDDIGRLIALTVSAGFFGVFFAIPLRKYFIIHQRLVFPTPTATAFTIRSLHSGTVGAQVARKKSLALLYSLVIVFCYKVATGYAPGLIYDWHIGWTLYQLGWRGALSIENYGWFIEFTPAFFGAGMLSGINASWSFFMGSVLAWGVIAPSLVKNGQAVGIPIGGDEYPTAYSYFGMSFANNSDYIDNPSPRYWLLWPGVFMMLVFSFAELFMSSRSLIGGLKLAGASFKDAISRLRNPDAAASAETEDLDPSKPEDRVKPWIWMTGLFLSIVMSCALLATQFSVGVGEAILALLLGFMFSFIGVQSAGDTDINPVSTVAKASQLVFGGVSKGQGHDPKTGQTLNLIAGTVAAGSAAQATDMTGDLRTGHLLSAKPKNQFVAQLVGSVVASFLTVGLFVLFASASPCIMYPPEDGHCTYGAPSVSAWAAVAVAVTSPRLPIPKSSGYTSIALGIFAGISVVVKHLWVPHRYWKYVPNWNAVGLGFVVPQVYYSFAMAVGSVVTWFWLKRSPVSYDMYLFPLSAGMLAGEGLGGVFQALLQVAGVAGADYGSAIGCPYFEFCG